MKSKLTLSVIVVILTGLNFSVSFATAQDAVVATFPVSSVGASAISTDGTFAFITTSSGNRAYRLNLMTNTITDTYTVTGDSYRTAISPDGLYGLVLNYSGTTVSKITFSNGNVTNYSGFSNPRSVAFIPNTSVALVTNWGSTSVGKIDVSIDSVTSVSYGLAGNPLEVSVSPDGSKALFSIFSSNISSLVNLSTGSIIRSYAANNPGVSRWTSDGSVIYQTSQGTTNYYKIDPASTTINSYSIASGSYGLAVGRDGSYLLIALSNGSFIRIATSSPSTTAATYSGYTMPWDFQIGYNSTAGEFALMTDRSTTRVYRIFETSPIAPATLTLAPSLSSAVYRTSMTLTASSNYAGKINFYANGKKIPGCVNRQTNLIVTNDATCQWSPSAHTTFTLFAIITPSTNGIQSARSPEIRVPVALRLTKR